MTIITDSWLGWGAVRAAEEAQQGGDDREADHEGVDEDADGQGEADRPDGRVVVEDEAAEDGRHDEGGGGDDPAAALQTAVFDRGPYHDEDLRTALLARAEETLREKGAAALSLREVARDLGVSHNVPSRHFKDKQALLDALALGGYERTTAAMVASQTDAGESGREKLEAVVRAYVGFSLDNTALLGLMYSIKHDPQASAALLEATDRWAELIEGLILEGQRRGEAREGPLDLIGIPVFATLHGYADLAANGLLAPEVAERGLGDVIAFILRGCAPDARA